MRARGPRSAAQPGATVGIVAPIITASTASMTNVFLFMFLQTPPVDYLPGSRLMRCDLPQDVAVQDASGIRDVAAAT